MMQARPTLKVQTSEAEAVEGKVFGEKPKMETDETALRFLKLEDNSSQHCPRQIDVPMVHGKMDLKLESDASPKSQESPPREEEKTPAQRGRTGTDHSTTGSRTPKSAAKRRLSSEKSKTEPPGRGAKKEEEKKAEEPPGRGAKKEEEKKA